MCEAAAGGIPNWRNHLGTRFRFASSPAESSGRLSERVSGTANGGPTPDAQEFESFIFFITWFFISSAEVNAAAAS